MTARIEAIATWTEMLRDTLSAAARLEQAILATAPLAPTAIRGEVGELATGIENGDRLAPALRRLGERLDDPVGDLVIAALLLAAEQQTRQLAELLGSLADAARGHASMRMRVEAGRARTRTSVRVIVGTTLAFAVAVVLLNRNYMGAYDSAARQIVLLAIGGLFPAGFAWLSRIARVAQPDRFLSDHVFGEYRRHLLDANLRHLDATVAQEREQQVTGLRRAITDIDIKIKRTIRNFELVDDPDKDFVRDINERRVELRAQREQLETRLAEAEQRILAAPNLDLIDTLPMMKIEVDQLPEELARTLFEALRLEIRYNRDTHTATCRVTLTGPTITAASRTANEAAIRSLNDARQRRDQCKQSKRNRSHP